MPPTLVATDSTPILEDPRDDSDFVTEVVVGERVEVLEESSGGADLWLRVVVPSHATRLDARGYPGWARAGNLIEAPDWSPTHKIVAANEAGLPLGALLESIPDGLSLPGGERVEIEVEKTLPVEESLDLSPVELSRTLLGLPYRWGGTDSTLGMDCSGLAFRVMQLLGVTIPRDADDQFDRAPTKSRESWKRARENDLVFFGSESVTHVGFYLGDGTYISEHGDEGTAIRYIEEDPYRGFARHA